jgi:hypothetical protein
MLQPKREGLRCFSQEGMCFSFGWSFASLTLTPEPQSPCKKEIGGRISAVLGDMKVWAEDRRSVLSLGESHGSLDSGLLVSALSFGRKT